MSRLVQLPASNLLTKEDIPAAGDDLYHLNLNNDNQLPDENLGTYLQDHLLGCFTFIN